MMSKNIEPHNDNGLAHGLWEVYWVGSLWYKCHFLNDKEEGYEEWYSGDGSSAELSHKTFYLI